MIMIKLQITNTEATLEAPPPILNSVAEILTFQKSTTSTEQLYKYDSRLNMMKYSVGLLPRVLSHLDNDNIPIHIFDLRHSLPIFDKVVTGIEAFDFFEHQRAMVAAANNFIPLPPQSYYAGCFAIGNQQLYFPRGVFDASTGSGKTAVMIGIMLSFLQPFLQLSPFLNPSSLKKVKYTKIHGVSGTNMARVLCLINSRLSFESLQNAFEKLLGTAIGVITADESIKLRPFTLGMYQTVGNRLKDPSFARTINRYFNVVFIDEAHYSGADFFYNHVLEHINIHSRFFFSGTPFSFEFEARKFRVIAQSGPTLYQVSDIEMIDKGISLLPIIKKYKIFYPAPDVPYGEQKINIFMQTIGTHRRRNAIIAFEASSVSDGMAVVAYRYKAHGELLEDYLNRYCAHFNLKKTIARIDGSHSGEARKRVLRAANAGEIDILIASSVLKEAVDIKCIMKLILAAPSKAPIYINQIVGRATRAFKNYAAVEIIDFLDVLKNYPRHSEARDEVFREKGGHIYYYTEKELPFFGDKRKDLSF